MISNSNRARVFGNDVDTDQLAPGIYLKQPIEEIAKHCLEAIAPDFASSVKSGDLVAGGLNFGMGSSREQAAEALRYLGIKTIIAVSFGGIFYRNALNFGLLPLVCARAREIKESDQVSVNPEAGEIHNITSGDTYSCEALPENLLNIIRAGGLLPHLAEKLDQEAKPQ